MLQSCYKMVTIPCLNFAEITSYKIQKNGIYSLNGRNISHLLCDDLLRCSSPLLYDGFVAIDEIHAACQSFYHVEPFRGFDNPYQSPVYTIYI